MIKSKKGFTLVELLGVLVVLMVISLMAFSIINNRVKEARKNAVEVDANNYVKAINGKASISQNEEVEMESGTYEVRDLNKLDINISGNKPRRGFLVLYDFEVIGGCLRYENYSAIISGGKTTTVTKSACSKDGFIATYSYSNSEKVFTAATDGTYKIELWGASTDDISNCSWSGCTSYVEKIGKGAYTSGLIELNKNDKLHIYVGEVGASGTGINNKIVFNGGGTITNEYNDGNNFTGGGATDVRLVGGNWDNSESLASRIMVAGGGGGTVYPIITEGNAGGLSSNQAQGPENAVGNPSTQTTGYLFGKGQPNARAGAGGGYWGGYSQSYAGAGGTSYISGYVGCVAIASASSTSPRKDSNNVDCTNESALNDVKCSEHYSGKKFTDAIMKAGNEIMPTHDGTSTMTGNEGNGYAKITLVK